MAKSSKLVAVKRGKVLLVRRRRDRLWMFPGGRKRVRESEKDCLQREIREELPKLKLGRIRLWKEMKAKNRRSGRKMSDAILCSLEDFRKPDYWRQKRDRHSCMAQATRDQTHAHVTLCQRQVVSKLNDLQHGRLVLSRTADVRPLLIKMARSPSSDLRFLLPDATHLFRADLRSTPADHWPR
jgi:ADP-ribose pyrophosphatase YjhB (NUDIX family)